MNLHIRGREITNAIKEGINTTLFGLTKCGIRPIAKKARSNNVPSFQLIYADLIR